MPWFNLLDTQENQVYVEVRKKKNKKEKAFNVKNCQIEAKSEKIFFKSLRNWFHEKKLQGRGKWRCFHKISVKSIMHSKYLYHCKWNSWWNVQVEEKLTLFNTVVTTHKCMLLIIFIFWQYCHSETLHKSHLPAAWIDSCNNIELIVSF